MGKGKRNREARSQPYQMSRAEAKAMKREINNQILRSDAEYYYDMDACVLWALHEVFGFGYTRLKRFFDAFEDVHENLRQYYQADDNENSVWICRILLKERCGVDVAEWEEQKEKEKKQK